MKRMDRYKEEKAYYQPSRSDKNQELYQNLGSNVRYANYSDVVNANAYDISNSNQDYYTREGYQKYREYPTAMPMPVPPIKKELDDFNHLYHDNEKKIYDINSVLEQARENRVDELDEKRKLKNEDYNIFSKINKTELEKFRRERNRKDTKQDNELREFIDTITSKTLAGELDKDTTVDLLSDLMATNMMDKVDPQKEEQNITKSQELKDLEELKKLQELTNTKLQKQKEPVEEITEFKDADTDFYTRSMDLSEKDFNFSSSDVEKKLSLPIKIFLFFVIVIVTIVVAYFIYQCI